jgi:hypothetical protein
VADNRTDKKDEKTKQWSTKQKLKIEQHEPYWKERKNSAALDR